MLIQRKCVATMLEKLPEIADVNAKKHSPLAENLDRLWRPFDIMHVDGARLSEDLSFCHRWRNLCGGEIWANFSHEITHMGLQQFAGRFADVAGSGPQVTTQEGS